MGEPGKLPISRGNTSYKREGYLYARILGIGYMLRCEEEPLKRSANKKDAPQGRAGKGDTA
jgi:hypothetical protein